MSTLEDLLGTQDNAPTLELVEVTGSLDEFYATFELGTPPTYEDKLDQLLDQLAQPTEPSPAFLRELEAHGYSVQTTPDQQQQAAARASGCDCKRPCATVVGHYVKTKWCPPCQWDFTLVETWRVIDRLLKGKEVTPATPAATWNAHLAEHNGRWGHGPELPTSVAARWLASDHPLTLQAQDRAVTHRLATRKQGKAAKAAAVAQLSDKQLKQAAAGTRWWHTNLAKVGSDQLDTALAVTLAG